MATPITSNSDPDSGEYGFVYGDNSDESQDRAAVDFGPTFVSLTGYWNGNGGEWAGDWLGATLDREAVEHLRDQLTKWLEAGK